MGVSWQSLPQVPVRNKILSPPFSLPHEITDLSLLPSAPEQHACLTHTHLKHILQHYHLRVNGI